MRYIFRNSFSDFALTMALFSPIVLAIEFLHIGISFSVSTFSLRLFSLNKIGFVVLIKGLISILIYITFSVLFTTESFSNSIRKLFSNYDLFINMTLPYLIGMVTLFIVIIIFKNKLIEK
jgi:hypothetical protein